MRVSTVFISSTFVLAGMSAAFPVETEDMLVARFSDSDFLSEVEARAYDEPELYVHGGAISTNNYKTLSRHRRSFYEPSPYELTRRRLPDDTPDKRRVTFAPDTKERLESPPHSGTFRPSTPPIESSRSGFGASKFNMLNHRPGSNIVRSRSRSPRSFDELPRSELTRRYDSDAPRPETPPRRVTWTQDTADTPERPPRPRTPHPDSPGGRGRRSGHGNGNGNGNGNGHYHPRSFFDLD